MGWFPFSSTDVLSLLSAVEKQFTVPVEALKRRFDRFRNEAKQTNHELAHKAKEIERKVFPKVRRVVRRVGRRLNSQRTLQLKVDQRQFLLENYLWMAVCMAAFQVGRLLGENSFFFILEKVFTSRYSVPIAAYLLLPFDVHFYMQKTSLSEEKQRMVLFFASMLWGVVAGHISVSTPLTLLLPSPVFLVASIGFCSWFYASSLEESRFGFLTQCIGPAVAYYTLKTLTCRQPVPLLCWTASMTVLAMADLQMKLGAIRRQVTEVNGNEENWPSICVFVHGTSLLSWFFSLIF